VGGRSEEQGRLVWGGGEKGRASRRVGVDRREAAVQGCKLGGVLKDRTAIMRVGSR
jgi:hypothetical protein